MLLEIRRKITVKNKMGKNAEGKKLVFVRKGVGIKFFASRKLQKNGERRRRNGATVSRDDVAQGGGAKENVLTICIYLLNNCCRC